MHTQSSLCTSLERSGVELAGDGVVLLELNGTSPCGVASKWRSRQNGRFPFQLLECAGTSSDLVALGAPALAGLCDTAFAQRKCLPSVQLWTFLHEGTWSVTPSSHLCQNHLLLLLHLLQTWRMDSTWHQFESFDSQHSSDWLCFFCGAPCVFRT